MRFKKYSKLAHKHACRALYRALLTHTTRLPLSVELRTSAAYFVRYKFRKGLTISGAPRREALAAAYADEALLRTACQHDPTSVATVSQRIKALEEERAHLRELSLLPGRKKAPKPKNDHTPPKRKRKVRWAGMTVEERRAFTAEIRLRPPKIRNASGIPVLYWPGRPQAKSVSTAVSMRLKAKSEQIDVLKRLELVDLPLAISEDEWDVNLARFSGYRHRDGRNWVGSVKESINAVRDQYREDQKANREIIDRLYATIEREKEKWESIKLDRRKARRRRIRLRRKAYRVIFTGVRKFHDETRQLVDEGLECIEEMMKSTDSE